MVNKKRLKGKGPTPKAQDRVYHKAHRLKIEKERKRAADPKYAKIRKAKAKSKQLGRSTYEVIFGRNAVLEVIKANIPIHRIILASGIDFDDRIRQITQIASEKSLPLYEGARVELDAITKLGSHQGVAVQIPQYQYFELDDISNSQAIVVLDHITDPTNLGAIARCCAAFGANIIIPNSRSVEVNATVWKTSAGNLTKTKIAKVSNLNSTINRLKKDGYFVVGLDGNAKYLIKEQIVKNNSKVAFILGNEGKGISKLLSENCDVLAKIDTAVESLNVASATSIALYEFMRN